MCGINGIIYKNHKPGNLEIYNMNKAIKHRGPDDEGIYGFENASIGHVRLSILDLSSKGKQPMSCDNRIWITYNGEIYNYQEIKEVLKQKNYKFYSETDTEVILKAYNEWGEKCFEKFNGMWSLAILDNKKKELLISRDRYGVKPCYYFVDDKKFIFSSEIKGILSSNTEIQLDPNKFLIGNKNIEKFFTSNYENIEILPPGHILKFDIKNFKYIKNRWWRSLDHLPAINYNYQKSKKRIKELLYESTKLRLVSDAKISTSLSGGIDSGVIFSILNKYSTEHNLHLDPFIFKDNNIAYNNALELCSYYNRKPNIIKNIEYKFEDYPKLFSILESPSNYFNQIQIYKHQKKHDFKVSIDGHGADECLGGYSSNIMHFVFDYHNNLADTYQTLNTIVEKKFFIDYATKHKFANNITRFSDLNILKLVYPDQINNNLSQYVQNNTPLDIPKFFLDDLKDIKELEHGQQYLIIEANYGGLQWLLNKWDKASMASSVEIRSPFMDWKFFQYALALPNSFRTKKGRNKSILRDAFEDLLPQYINNDGRKQGLPSIKNIFDEKYINYLKEIHSQNEFLNNKFWNGKKIKNDFDLYINNNDINSIKKIEIFSKLYLMNKGLKKIKENNSAKNNKELDFNLLN